MFRVTGALHRWLYRLSGGKLGGVTRGVATLLLTVRGRKTGRKRTVPLLYGRDGDRYIVIASKGGDPKHPAWYLNLRAGEADLQVGRQHVHVRARDAEGDERERLWAMMARLYPPYAQYQEKTTREIPVVILEPLGTV